MVVTIRSTLAGFVSVWFYLFLVTHPVWSEPPSSDPLALVDKKPITAQAFANEMARRYPPQFKTPERKEALLEEMVRFELLYAAAQRAGYDKDPEIIQRFGRLMATKFRQDHLEPRLEKLSVSAKEIEDFYKSHKGDFIAPKRVRGAVIRITVPPRASEEKKSQLLQRAEAAREEALKLNSATSSFGPVAVKYSDHQASRYRGGDTGWLQAGRNDRRWSKEVVDAIFSLSEVGEISPVITAPDGYYLVKLMDRRLSSQQSLAAVKERIGHQLLQEKRTQVEDEFYGELEKQFPVKVFSDRLKTVEPLRGTTAEKVRKPPALPGQ